MLSGMRKKGSREVPKQPELPLDSGPREGESTEDVQRESTTLGSERRHISTVFEFEESTSTSSTDPAGGSRAGQDDATSEAGAVEPKMEEPRGKSEAERLFDEGKSASRGGRLEEAISLYRRVIAMDPFHLRARNNLGVLLDQMGDHDVAVEHFQAAADLQPENAEILTNLGAALAAQGRYDEAEAELKKAARIDPGGIDVRANLGILYFRRGLYSQSDHELRWVCFNDPDHTLAHFYRGEALNRLGRVDDALEMLERAAHLQPDRARIYYLMGILYDKKNLRNEAGVMYRKARELTDQ